MAAEQVKLAEIGVVLLDVLPCYAADAGTGCDERTPGKLEAVFVEGHTDNVPLQGGRFRDNWDLSAQRAIFTYRFSRSASPAWRTCATSSANHCSASAATARGVR